MRVGFVQEDDCAGIGVHVCQDKQGLLQSSPAGGQIEACVALPIPHDDLPSLLNVAGVIELRAKQIADPSHQLFPQIGVFAMNTEAKIA